MLFTPGDLAAYPGGPAGLSVEQYGITHDLTQELLVEVLGPLVDWTGEQSARARRVALRVAARSWRNPEGFESETIGSYTYRMGSVGGTDIGVWLTAVDRTELGGGTAAFSRVGSVKLQAYR